MTYRENNYSQNDNVGFPEIAFYLSNEPQPALYHGQDALDFFRQELKLSVARETSNSTDPSDSHSLPSIANIDNIYEQLVNFS